MSARTKTTISTLRARKREGRRISMLTCYDYTTARIMDEAGVDSLLVGDTYGEVILGHETTLPVTVEHLVTVTAAVRRGAPHVFLVGDMPYLSYQVSREDAIRNAGRFMAEAGCDCVKVEVDRRLAPTVEALATASIPVMAHLGLRPQSIHALGGYRAQGRTAEDARRIIEDAKIMEQAGAVALLLEAVCAEVATWITNSTSLPVIGIAAGAGCDGQVMVMQDMLGYSSGHPPRSAKRYAHLHPQLLEAFSTYAQEVAQQQFPSDDTSTKMEGSEYVRLKELLGGAAS
jgi:3-methyl-2-oxobutanoate hydroxymethyltransferase